MLLIAHSVVLQSSIPFSLQNNRFQYISSIIIFGRVLVQMMMFVSKPFFQLSSIVRPLAEFSPQSSRIRSPFAPNLVCLQPATRAPKLTALKPRPIIRSDPPKAFREQDNNGFPKACKKLNEGNLKDHCNILSRSKGEQKMTTNTTQFIVHSSAVSGRSNNLHGSIAVDQAQRAFAASLGLAKPSFRRPAGKCMAFFDSDVKLPMPICMSEPPPLPIIPSMNVPQETLNGTRRLQTMLARQRRVDFQLEKCSVPAIISGTNPDWPVELEDGKLKVVNPSRSSVNVKVRCMLTRQERMLGVRWIQHVSSRCFLCVIFSSSFFRF